MLVRVASVDNERRKAVRAGGIGDLWAKGRGSMKGAVVERRNWRMERFSFGGKEFEEEKMSVGKKFIKNINNNFEYQR